MQEENKNVRKCKVCGCELCEENKSDLCENDKRERNKEIASAIVGGLVGGLVVICRFFKKTDKNNC